MFGFPTYIVSKLYEEYHEDHLVVENNLNMSGGLFKSPNATPTHESKARQTVQAQKQHKGIGNGTRMGNFAKMNNNPNGISAAPPAPPAAAQKKDYNKFPSNNTRRDVSVPIIEIEAFE